jgi:hypothetical protein
MKKLLFAAVFAVFASTQAFAIIGVGAHYIMNTGSLKSDRGEISLGGQNTSIMVEQESASGLQGLGFKAWIDFLPFIDIEGTFNIAATRYKTSLKIGDNTIPLSYSPDAPYNMLFDNASPLYGLFTGDISITKPFDLPIIRPYIGVGISYFASIPIVNRDFAEKVLDENLLAILATGGEPEDLSKNLSKSLKDAAYKSGIGGHAIAGLRAKLPLIPIAAYVNGKYYFGGNIDSQFTQGFVLEVGGGFAI